MLADVQVVDQFMKVNHGFHTLRNIIKSYRTINPQSELEELKKKYAALQAKKKVLKTENEQLKDIVRNFDIDRYELE